jgi:hypothetical protein
MRQAARSEKRGRGARSEGEGRGQVNGPWTKVYGLRSTVHDTDPPETNNP